MNDKSWNQVAANPLDDIDEVMKLVETRPGDYDIQSLKEIIKSRNGGVIEPVNDDMLQTMLLMFDELTHGESFELFDGTRVDPVNVTTTDNMILIAQHENALNFEAIDRRFMIDINKDGLPDQNNKPWYNDHRNNRSKKSRRKL